MEQNRSAKYRTTRSRRTPEEQRNVKEQSANNSTARHVGSTATRRTDRYDESGIKTNKNKQEKSSIKGWIFCIIIAVAVAICVRYFIAEPIQVEGNSMNPSLFSHQTLLIEKVSRYFSLPERGDVVIVHYPDSKDNFVKRVIGLPGDTVSISDSTVYINGMAYPENYTSKEPYYDMDPVTVPEGHLFVMGDNRANSKDSREVGPISKDAIVGHAVCVIWPLDQWQNIS